MKLISVQIDLTKYIKFRHIGRQARAGNLKVINNEKFVGVVTTGIFRGKQAASTFFGLVTEYFRGFCPPHAVVCGFSHAY